MVTQGALRSRQFCMIPEWILYDDVSGNAVKLFGILQRHSGTDGQIMPGRQRLAELMRCSTDTVDRALAELAAIGAVEKRPRYRAGTRERTTNSYHLWPFADGPGRKSAAGGSRTEAATGSRTDAESERELNLKESKYVRTNTKHSEDERGKGTTKPVSTSQLEFIADLLDQKGGLEVDAVRARFVSGMIRSSGEANAAIRKLKRQPSLEEHEAALAAQAEEARKRASDVFRANYEASMGECGVPDNIDARDFAAVCDLELGWTTNERFRRFLLTYAPGTSDVGTVLQGRVEYFRELREADRLKELERRIDEAFTPSVDQELMQGGNEDMHPCKDGNPF